MVMATSEKLSATSNNLEDDDDDDRAPGNRRVKDFLVAPKGANPRELPTRREEINSVNFIVLYYDVCNITDDFVLNYGT